MSDSRDIVNQLVTALDRACRSLGFAEYMPEAMIGHFVRQVVPSSFSNNQLDLGQFYEWVRQEYSVPDHVFGRVFSKLSEVAEELGITIVQPDSYEPGFGETVKEWMKYELKEVAYSDLKEELREEVRKELYNELRPVVYSEIRSWMEGGGTGEPELDEELLDAMEGRSAAANRPATAPPTEIDITGMVEPAPNKEDIRQELIDKLKPEVEDDLYRELRPLLDKKIREELIQQLRPRVEEGIEESVREELRRELWNEVREEVKEDLRTVLTPVLEGELRKELLEEAKAEGLEIRQDAAPDMQTDAGPGFSKGPGIAFRAEDQLYLIRKIREKLTPVIRQKVFADISELAQSIEEQERKERYEKLLSDPDYCLEKIREFLFPDQPGLWDKVKPLIRPHEWEIIVRAQGEDESLFDAEKLERSRKVIREALKLKAEIGDEISFTPEGMESGGKKHSSALKQALVGADDMLDFALKSISEILEETDPAQAAG